ncbi:MAG: histidine phosphatase family protein [Bacteroidetes bacterium]|nr:histidine phosphatase family protein [Bacteroidota bacterium]MDA1121833.1 histidine phosphatase family protein [Bacteroidota bacterium]
MKTLFLVRHAKSSWDNMGLSDFDRPLNDRGFADAPSMGNFLKGLAVRPDLILSSPAKRAFSTANLIAKEIGYNNTIQTDQGIYHANTRELMLILTVQDNNHNSIMMVGHNPGFTDFCNKLTGDFIDNMPTCSICRIDFDVDSWTEISFGTGNKIFFQYPKGLS